jgi:hypothetical protein
MRALDYQWIMAAVPQFYNAKYSSQANPAIALSSSDAWPLISLSLCKIPDYSTPHCAYQNVCPVEIPIFRECFGTLERERKNCKLRNAVPEMEPGLKTDVRL